MSGRLFGKLLMALGVLILIGATVWWYLFYSQIPALALQDARECFYFVTDQCAIQNAAGNAVSHIGSLVHSSRDVPTYHPAAFWSSMVTLLAGVLIWGASD